MGGTNPCPKNNMIALQGAKDFCEFPLPLIVYTPNFPQDVSPSMHAFSNMYPRFLYISYSYLSPILHQPRKIEAWLQCSKDWTWATLTPTNMLFGPRRLPQNGGKLLFWMLFWRIQKNGCYPLWHCWLKSLTLPVANKIFSISSLDYEGGY